MLEQCVDAHATPAHVQLGHLVTQLMSTVSRAPESVELGPAPRNGLLDEPRSKAPLDQGRVRRRPADSTGKSSVRYCPGGMRCPRSEHVGQRSRASRNGRSLNVPRRWSSLSQTRTKCPPATQNRPRPRRAFDVAPRGNHRLDRRAVARQDATASRHCRRLRCDSRRAFMASSFLRILFPNFELIAYVSLFVLAGSAPAAIVPARVRLVSWLLIVQQGRR